MLLNALTQCLYDKVKRKVVPERTASLYISHTERLQHSKGGRARHCL